MSLEQKVNVTTGVGWSNGRCVGNTPAIDDLFPSLCLEDSPIGVRDADFVTAFPAGINAATTCVTLCVSGTFRLLLQAGRARSFVPAASLWDRSTSAKVYMSHLGP